MVTKMLSIYATLKLLPLTLTVLVTAVMIASVSSDFAEDRQECKDQLVDMATCLPFVSGESKTPTPQCCWELTNRYNATEKCLCTLVKDRDEPELGFKVNATLALTLPFICHGSSNASHCIELLHLAPNSPEAKVFEDFVSSTKSNATVPEDSRGTSGSVRRRRWLGFEWASLWFVISVFITIV